MPTDIDTQEEDGPIFGDGNEDEIDREEALEEEVEGEESEDQPETNDEQEDDAEGEEQYPVQSQPSAMRPADPPQQTVRIQVEQPKEKKKKVGRPRTITPEEIDPEDLQAMIEAFDPGSESGVYITIYRLEPKIYRGKSIEGYLDKFYHSVGIDEIKDRFGGGAFNVMVHGPKIDRKTGERKGIRILTRRKVRISGDPTIVEDEPRGGRHEDDPAMTEVVLGHSRAVMENIQKDKAAAADKADRMMDALLKKDDGGKLSEVAALVQSMMAPIIESTKTQLETSKEDARRAEKDRADAERRHQEEIREIRRDVAERAEREMNPMIELMKQTISDSKERNKETAAQMTDMAKLNIQMIQENNKNQIAMLMETNKTQVSILTNELNRISSELKETKIKDRGDLASELKKYKLIKGLFDVEGGGKEKESILSRLPELADIATSLPGILVGIKGMVSAGTPVPVQKPVRFTPARRTGKLPPKAELPPFPAPVAPMPATPPAEAPVTPEEQQQTADAREQQAELAIKINELKIKMEEAIDNGTEVEAFVDAEIAGKFEEDQLRQIAGLPTPAVIQELQNNLESEDSALTTVSGRDFMRRVHESMKRRYL